MTLERGGFGVDTAAPVAARILEHYFHLPITPRRIVRSRRRSDGSRIRLTTTLRVMLVPRGSERPYLVHGSSTSHAHPRRARIGERLNLPYFDGWLFGAALGLIAFSSSRSRSRRPTTSRASRSSSSMRQGIYALVGIALMLAVAKIDYSRFREIRVGIYSLMIGSICLVAALRRGRTRLPPLDRASRTSASSPRSSPSCCSIVALAAFVIERTRRGTPVRQTLRILALGLAPAALVFLQPDLGTGIVLVVITLAILFLAGVPWTHFAVIGGLAAVAVSFVLVIAPAAGLPSPLHGYQQDRLTSISASQQRPERRELSGQPERDRHRLRREDRTRRSIRPRPSSTSSPSGTPTSSSP